MVTVVDILGSSALYCCIFCEIRVIATEKKEESEHDISYGYNKGKQTSITCAEQNLPCFPHVIKTIKYLAPANACRTGSAGEVFSCILAAIRLSR